MKELSSTADLESEFLWLVDIQEDRKENLYVDFGHYNPVFSSEIATLIYERMQQAGLLATVPAAAHSP